MTNLKLSSILILASLLVIVFFVAEYIVFPLLNLALGIAAGIITAFLVVLILLIIYLYLQHSFRRR